jgi:predicted transcriptional regulator
MTDKDVVTPQSQPNMTGWQAVDDMFRYAIDKSAFIFMGISTAVLAFFVRRAEIASRQSKEESRQAKEESSRARRASRVNTKKLTKVQNTVGSRADSIDKKINETAEKTAQATLDATTINTAAADRIAQLERENAELRGRVNQEKNNIDT